MEGRELRRCYTQLDFSSIKHYNAGSGMHPHSIGQKSKAQPMSPKVKSKFPTQEIYRPPGERKMCAGQRDRDASEATHMRQPLNVHAKEFVMTSLQMSKSAGNILSHVSKTNASSSNTSNGILLSPTTTTRQTVKQNSYVKWKDKYPLTRSKSMSIKPSNQQNTADSFSSHYGLLSRHNYELIAKASKGKGSLKFKEMMHVVRLLLDKAFESRCYVNAVCIECEKIVQNTGGTMFLETVFNYCQYTLRKLKTQSVNVRFNGLMSFLCELYVILKPKQLFGEPIWRHTTPNEWLLKLLSQCCHEVLQDVHLHMKPDQVESLFLTITMVGRDLEREIPSSMDSLMSLMRDVFLTNKKLSLAIRHTLLQIIEIHAASWQLPAFALLYYKDHSY